MCVCECVVCGVSMMGGGGGGRDDDCCCCCRYFSDYKIVINIIFDLLWLICADVRFIFLRVFDSPTDHSDSTVGEIGENGDSAPVGQMDQIYKCRLHIKG